MSKNLDRIYTKLQNAFGVNFSDPIEVEGIVESININNQSFVLRSLDANSIMECYTKEDLSKLKDKDKVTVKGWLKFKKSQNSFSKIYIYAKFLYTESEKQKYTNAYEKYNKFKSQLESQKCQNAIRKIKSQEAPRMIYNVGLVVLPENDGNLENFKVVFQERCYGKLFIYRLKNDNIDTSLPVALEYFKKYHNIDIICLLTNQLTFKNICDLSSLKNVTYMINRKQCPYIMTVESTNKEKTMMEPLVFSLTNTKVSGIIECVNFIHNVQANLRKDLEMGIQKGTDILKKLVEKEKRKLFEHKIQLANLVDPKYHRNTKGLIDSPFERLRDMVLQKLYREKIKLSKISITIMRNIIDDSRVQGYFEKLVAWEKSNFNDVKKQVSSQSLTSPASKSTNNREDMSYSIKKNALQQNQYFQTHPENIAQATKTLDTMVSEMATGCSTTKKIENKSPDNIPGDILSINIQRTNGDF
ncbi:hypothetical protein QJ856_gp0815 [Tupanvirus deep ocean]|uniref:Uncharacterized protein n=2 Tax=Tupanvirus TaxID=2094720 RepID=A0AC62A8J1_9VIRU|nr:hypothetical protein QJ856_gp0815 [Tupanvirus deep ocean]QKU33938.1 hypothetical protein [Tupanvirus deep ocean]